MSVIIDNRTHWTREVSVSIPYDITQLDLSGAKIQVKFDAKIAAGVGSKFMVRHSNSSHQGIDGSFSPLMESSSKGTSHVFTTDLTNEIIQNSKFFTVLSNGNMGMDKIDLEVTNIEIRTLEHVQIDGSLYALKTYQIVKKGEESDTNDMGSGVLLITSEQAKPAITKMGEVLFESDTGKVFYYDGTEWREFV